MTTPQWLSIIATLVGAAAVWGSLRNQVGNISTSLEELRREFNRSREEQGKRLGELETGAKVGEAVRRATGAAGVPAHRKLPPSEE